MVGKPRVVAIIQARMGSTRLPGKVMADICGRPMLAHVIERIQRSRTISDICVAATTCHEDEIITQLAARLRVAAYSGSVNDVLDRYYRAALQVGAEIIVRITGDCPLIDSQVIDKVVSIFLQGDHDYVSNTLRPTYPDGLDTEVFSLDALTQAWREARLRSEREHVTPFINKHRELFRVLNVQCNHDLSALRWTVDEPSDLEMVRIVYKHLYPKPFGMDDVLRLLQEHPEIARINAGIERDEGYRKSLHEDSLVLPAEG